MHNILSKITGIKASKRWAKINFITEYFYFRLRIYHITNDNTMIFFLWNMKIDRYK